MTACSALTLPRWTPDDARQVIAALDRSGQSVSAFAGEHGIDPQRLYLWRRRLGASAERTTFHELALAPTRRMAPTREGLELVFPSGVLVRVPASFDAEALARLLEVLAQASVC
jgi:transposase-like protein